MIDYNQLIKETLGIMTAEKMFLAHGGDIEIWKETLISMLKDKELKIVYKLNTEELIEDYDNDWVNSLGVLAKDFKFKNKKEYIDGSYPENIAIGFINI